MCAYIFNHCLGRIASTTKRRPRSAQNVALLLFYDPIPLVSPLYMYVRHIPVSRGAGETEHTRTTQRHALTRHTRSPVNRSLRGVPTLCFIFCFLDHGDGRRSASQVRPEAPGGAPCRGRSQGYPDPAEGGDRRRSQRRGQARRREAPHTHNSYRTPV